MFGASATRAQIVATCRMAIPLVIGGEFERPRGGRAITVTGRSERRIVGPMDWLGTVRSGGLTLCCPGADSRVPEDLAGSQQGGVEPPGDQCEYGGKCHPGQVGEQQHSGRDAHPPERSGYFAKMRHHRSADFSEREGALVPLEEQPAPERVGTELNDEQCQCSSGLLEPVSHARRARQQHPSGHRGASTWARTAILAAPTVDGGAVSERAGVCGRQCAKRGSGKAQQRPGEQAGDLTRCG